ncbi:MAG: hypothetical protein ABEL76_15540 [Bradymonadaceae bacterium]
MSADEPEDLAGEDVRFAEFLRQRLLDAEPDVDPETLDHAEAVGKSMDTVVDAYVHAEQVVNELEEKLDDESVESVDINAVARLLVASRRSAGS